VGADTDPPAWIADAILYQIFPDRFARSLRVHKPGHLEEWDAPPTRLGFKGGDLLGIAEHLDYLVDLGINTVSLNPIFASAANHRYHTYDYRQVDPLLGGDAALRELLDAAHQRDLRVILDGVFNHAGRGFWPFHHVMENGSASPYVDWFILDPEWLASGKPLRAYPDASSEQEIAADWALAHAAGHESLSTLGYRAWWDLPALPKLNTENPEVREFLLGVAEHWTRFGADGWRLDVATEIETPGFWHEFRRRVRVVNPHAYIVAEVWDERPELLDGHSFDGLMNYSLLCAIVGFAAGAHLDQRTAGQQSWLGRNLLPLDGEGFGARLDRLMSEYRPAARSAMLNLLGGHDTPRLLTMGGGDRATARLAVLAQMTLPGVPCIYYGDEIGLDGGMDPASRGAFPWDSGAWDSETLACTKALIGARRTWPVLRGGEVRLLAAAGPAVAYLRAWTSHAPTESGGPSTALVGLNNSESSASLRVGSADLGGATWTSEPLPGLPVLPDLTAGPDGSFALDLPARSGVLLHPR
jgi:cyclomaltodextrinase / maltogenic alpha-amylase / neopullulanase